MIFFFNIHWVTILGGEGGEGASKSYQRSLSMPGSGSSLSSPRTPGSPGTPNTYSPTAARKDNVWRSVFNPGSNSATKRIGAEVFDKPSHPNAPTVYDWYALLNTTPPPSIKKLIINP